MSTRPGRPPLPQKQTVEVSMKVFHSSVRSRLIACASRSTSKTSAGKTKSGRRRRNPLGPLKSNSIQCDTGRSGSFFSSSTIERSCPNSAYPSHVEVNEKFRTLRQQHPGDAVPRESAAVVAAVTRDRLNCSPTCDAFRRICRSDASSSALCSFGLKLE
jgi:hypothetical protein